MCPGCCGRVWTVLHVIWSVVYVTCGAAQLIAGIFFLISLPALKLTSNLWAGSWNVVVGIAMGMVACFGDISPKRQELLLYMAVSILTVNTVNAVLSEWSFYHTDMELLLEEHPFHILVNYARIGTGIAAAVVIVVSFVDSQLAFCSMHATPRRDKKLHGSHEQVSDIEYIIPRPKSNSSAKPTNTAVYNAYAQSWVFDADVVESPSPKAPEGRGKKPHITTSDLVNGSVKEDAEVLVNDSPVVLIEEASDDTTSNSDRKLCYMKSFSHNASPVVLSASSSQISLNKTYQINPPPIYECLEKLTEQSVYRSRLNTALSNRGEEEESHYQAPSQTTFAMRREAASPRGAEKGQYASLMMELERAITKKDKTPVLNSPPSRSNSSSSHKTQTNSNSKSSSRQDSSHGGKNSDAEFSKELEAALQLIQDLESPNTIETPSEPLKEVRPLAVWRNSDLSDGSEKTLSALGSLAELTSPLADFVPDMYTFKPPPMNGKAARALIHCDSQSTSGYSSPTHKNWSSTSSTNSSSYDLGKTLAYSIHNTKSSAVISLYPQQQTQVAPSRGRSVTLVTITSEDESRDSSDDLPPPPSPDTLEKALGEINNNTPKAEAAPPANAQQTTLTKEDESDKRPQGGSTSLWNVKSILRKKKVNPPRMNPELESAIVKSESLAYMTKLELLARHQRSKEIQRQIEHRIQQQLGTPRADSAGTRF